MNILTPGEIKIFDNLYSKPAQIGYGPGNFEHSMEVLFSARGIIYDGQYNYLEGKWRTVPADDKMREFLDKDVEYWFYGPQSLDLFKNYAKDVSTKQCLDPVCRIYEFDENQDRAEEK